MKLLEDKLGIDGVSTYEVLSVDLDSKIVPVKSEEPEEDDFDFVRENYYDMIQQGSVALAGALRVASESENPRAYEVVGGLLKQLSDVNKQLLNISEDKEKVKTARRGNRGESPTPITNHNTAIFVGDSNALDDLLEKRKNKMKTINESDT